VQLALASLRTGGPSVRQGQRTINPTAWCAIQCIQHRSRGKTTRSIRSRAARRRVPRT